MSETVDPAALKALFIAITSLNAAIGLCLLLLVADRGVSAYQFLEQTLSRFAARPVIAASVLFLSVIGLRLIVLPLLPVPTPRIHDEFSYLLMADTFVHGRLTNPTHPLWMSFETFHVNWHPTYASMYSPAQGLILAVGQFLGHPWFGVLLSNAAMCVAIFWALQAWVPIRWAFCGAVIAELKLSLTSYWVNSYWGGAAAAIGGALVLGGLGRLRRRASLRDSVLFALGIAVLANSRPYESLFFCLPALCWFSYWLAGRTRTKTPWTLRFRNGLLPVGSLLIITVAFIGYYDWRVTGSALLMPRAVNIQTYYTTPLFLWQQPKPEIHYNNMVFQVFYDKWLNSTYHTGWLYAKKVSLEKISLLQASYFWAGSALALPALPFLLLDRKMRIFWITLATTLAAIFAVVWSNPHYAAPLTVVFYALLVQAMRHLRTMHFSKLRYGVALSRAIILFLLLETGTRLCYRMCDSPAWPCAGNPLRAALAKELRSLPGKHLVIVRYAEHHDPHNEWVFNGADIDGSKVVWARELNTPQNDKLLAYFKDRHVWLVRPDSGDTEIKPYAAPDASQTNVIRSNNETLPSSVVVQNASPGRKED